MNPYKLKVGKIYQSYCKDIDCQYRIKVSSIDADGFHGEFSCKSKGDLRFGPSCGGGFFYFCDHKILKKVKRL